MRRQADARCGHIELPDVRLSTLGAAFSALMTNVPTASSSFAASSAMVQGRANACCVQGDGWGRLAAHAAKEGGRHAPRYQLIMLWNGGRGRSTLSVKSQGGMHYCTPHALRTSTGRIRAPLPSRRAVGKLQAASR